MYYGRSEKRAARLHFSVGIKSKEKVVVYSFLHNVELVSQWRTLICCVSLLVLLFKLRIVNFLINHTVFK